MSLSKRVPRPTGGDDTAMIQQAADSAPDGGRLCFPDGGDYQSEGTLNFTNRSLTVLGNGSSLTAMTFGAVHPELPDRRSTRRHVAVSGCTNFKMRNLSVHSVGDGQYKFDYEEESAFFIAGGDNLSFEGCKGFNTNGDLFEITGYPITKAKGTNLTISNCQGDVIDRQGITFFGSWDGLTIKSSSWDHVTRSVFDLELVSVTAVLENVMIGGPNPGDGNTIGEFVNFCIGSGGGKGVQRNITYQGNRHTGSRGMLSKIGVARGVTDRWNFAFKDNIQEQIILGIGGNAVLQCRSTEGLTVTGNQVPCQPAHSISLMGLTGGDPSIIGNRCCDVYAANNSCPGAGSIWPAPGPPGFTDPTICMWTDGGGNTL